MIFITSSSLISNWMNFRIR